MARDVLPELGARVVFSGYARTVVGATDYHKAQPPPSASPAAQLVAPPSGDRSFAAGEGGGG